MLTDLLDRLHPEDPRRPAVYAELHGTPVEPEPQARAVDRELAAMRARLTAATVRRVADLEHRRAEWQAATTVAPLAEPEPESADVDHQKYDHGQEAREAAHVRQRAIRQRALLRARTERTRRPWPPTGRRDTVLTSPT
jgi:hypothetical protein